VDAVKTNDGPTVRGSVNVDDQSVDLKLSIQAARLVFFLSVSSPDQGHRIVRMACGPR
jgi:hypothetical protein